MPVLKNRDALIIYDYIASTYRGTRFYMDAYHTLVVAAQNQKLLNWGITSYNSVPCSEYSSSY